MVPQKTWSNMSKHKKRAILNDRELGNILKMASLPERQAVYWKQFPKRVMDHLRTKSQQRNKEK